MEVAADQTTLDTMLVASRVLTRWPLLMAALDMILTRAPEVVAASNTVQARYWFFSKMPECKAALGRAGYRYWA